MSENLIKTIEDEIQSLHDSIEGEQAELYNKREELKNLKDPNWKEKEEQLKVKEFLEKANVNLEKWSLVEEDFLKGAYIEESRVMAFSAKPKVNVSKHRKICFDLSTLFKFLSHYQGNYSTTIKLYTDDSGHHLIFHDENIWGYLAKVDVYEGGDEFEETKEIVVKIVEGKHKTEIEKIVELQELLNKAKNLIFAAQDIAGTIEFPYCLEIQEDDRNTESMRCELSIIRSYLEWMDNKCWSYWRLKQ